MTAILFISLIHLIQHPETYHEKPVRVIGFASLKFEGKALYVSREDYEKAITKNAVWLDIELTEDVKKLHGKYVLVEGVFDKDNLGHLKLFSGSIKNIGRIELWNGKDKSGK
jgi:hypothetical protein